MFEVTIEGSFSTKLIVPGKTTRDAELTAKKMLEQRIGIPKSDYEIELLITGKKEE